MSSDRRPDNSPDGSDLPSHLTESDVEAAVEEADTLLDVQRILRVTDRKQCRQILKERGLEGEVAQAGQDFATELGQ